MTMPEVIGSKMGSDDDDYVVGLKEGKLGTHADTHTHTCV